MVRVIWNHYCFLKFIDGFRLFGTVFTKTNTEEDSLTKTELIEKMAKDADISKVAAGTVLDFFIDGVTKALKKKDAKFTLVGFGTFGKIRWNVRKGHNPQTGEAIKIKASNAVKFKAGKKLKDAV